jgi:hypothetical protein
MKQPKKPKLGEITTNLVTNQMMEERKQETNKKHNNKNPTQ